MIKYVLLTFAVPGIGGTQIYARNKILYLREHGYEPILITEEIGGEIIVKELLPYKDYVVPELLYSPMLMSRKKREAALTKMASIIGDVDNDTIIESNFIHATLWGELLAKKLGVKHFVFLIQEDYSLSDIKYMRYFDFKLQRGEIAGNTPVALKKLFEGYKDIPAGDRYYLSAYCSNTVEYCESTHENCIVDADYHIGSIGRINKPFVLHMVDRVIDYARKHSDNTFQLVLFGGSSENKDIDRIIDVVSTQKNISVYITGPIFPVPISMLRKMDVFISSAGAASTSADVGLVTIAIDANDYEPIGIVGYTTDNTVHRTEDLPRASIDQLLEQVLVQRKYTNTESLIPDEKAKYTEAFDKHMEYVHKSSVEKGYYDVHKIAPNIISRTIHILKK